MFQLTSKSGRRAADHNQKVPRIYTIVTLSKGLQFNGTAFQKESYFGTEDSVNGSCQCTNNTTQRVFVSPSSSPSLLYFYSPPWPSRCLLRLGNPLQRRFEGLKTRSKTRTAKSVCPILSPTIPDFHVFCSIFESEKPIKEEAKAYPAARRSMWAF